MSMTQLIVQKVIQIVSFAISTV